MITASVFLACFAAGCLLAFVRHPIYGLMTYVAVFYLHPPSRWWGAALPELRWSLIAAGVTLLAVLFQRQQPQTYPLFRNKVMLGLLVFLGWVAVQTLWAFDMNMHLELLTLLAKYTLLVGLIYKCVDSEKHLSYFLWSHVLGCLYLGWIVFSTYSGGRFEGFGGPDINEANAGALQVVTGIFVGSSIFLAGKLRQKAAVLGCMPFIVNALIATISRSGFLALGVGGLIFNYFAPLRQRLWVGLLSTFAAVLFVSLTNPVYWARVASLMYAGEEVEGVDTGSGRLVLMEAQWRMFLDNPLGCGHRCTVILSRDFLSDEHLTGQGESRGRSSHSTPMSLLVEQGLPGALFYLLLIMWLVKTLRALRRQFKAPEHQGSFNAALLPAVAAALGAITIGDIFVDYLKLEVRMWFVATLMVMVKMAMLRSTEPAPGRLRRSASAVVAPKAEPSPALRIPNRPNPRFRPKSPARLPGARTGSSAARR